MKSPFLARWVTLISISLGLGQTQMFASESGSVSYAGELASGRNWVVLKEAWWSKDYWALDPSAIPQILTQTKVYLEDLKDKDPSENRRQEIRKILSRWNQYGCQIVCYIKDGKRLIRLNYFPLPSGNSHEFNDWRQRYIEVEDGGASFWRVNYDYGAGIFSDFSSNGYA